MGIKDYRDLIQLYLDGNLPIDKFKNKYSNMLLNEPRGMDRTLFLILQDFFEDLDAYSPLWTSEDESPIRLTERSIRQEAVEALNQLSQYSD